MTAMVRVAIPFSDLAGGEHAVGARLRGARAPSLEVELIAMVEPLRSGKVAVFVSRDAARAQCEAAATAWLAHLGSVLAQAGVHYTSRTAIGPPTRTLRELAVRRDLARIVIAGPATRPWRTRWRQLVLRAASAPVTVVP